ncbi:YvaD family protein [Brevibacillus sp. SYP-B805]|uniref:YvaD family protein n=1 Tax=Brevibacillus sp. SYP-B805 TaxID=1578199 RepID=UPI0013EA5FE1|nr:YvaD family protein [Brevibacillus sp. SYP-B805]NGQ94936.1 YvaD family protein [Brevibacillus sp. SYP-B805]
MGSLKYFFWITDAGFLIYWFVTFFQLIPVEYLYQDYTNPILVSWNWSFFPLDLIISLTGFASLWLHANNRSLWRDVALISLVLTFVSGLQAIAFWAIRCDIDLVWWIPNGFLLIYPLYFIPRLLQKRTPRVH